MFVNLSGEGLGSWVQDSQVEPDLVISWRYAVLFGVSFIGIHLINSGGLTSVSWQMG